MTYQQKLEDARRDSDNAIKHAQRPGVRIGFANGIAGFTAVDNGQYPRTVQGALGVSDIDELIDDLLLAREHLMNTMPTQIDCEVPEP